jgi:voltage-gated potassium channel
MMDGDCLRSAVNRLMSHMYYQLSIGILALVCVFSLLSQYSGNTALHLTWLDQLIYVIFVIDYFAGLWSAEDRKHYVKTHVIELITILPFSIWFQSARILQVIRIVRALIYFKRSLNHFGEAFAKHHFFQTILVSCILVMTGGLTVYLLEPDSFEGNWTNSIWWAAVTATTVGYGDFFPVTFSGRVVAVVIMLLGTAFVGLLSGILAGYYVRHRIEEETDPWKEAMIEQISKLEKLSLAERKQLIRMIDTYTQDVGSDPVIQAEQDSDLRMEKAHDTDSVDKQK